MNDHRQYHSSFISRKTGIVLSSGIGGKLLAEYVSKKLTVIPAPLPSVISLPSASNKLAVVVVPDDQAAVVFARRLDDTGYRVALVPWIICGDFSRSS